MLYSRAVLSKYIHTLDVSIKHTSKVAITYIITFNHIHHIITYNHIYNSTVIKVLSANA